MTIQFRLLAFILVLPVLYLLAQIAILSLAFVQDHHVWHQKLTVTVETPSGERTGSAVVEVRAAFGQQPLSGNEVQYTYTGEATVVEVAPGRYLFALLGGSEERFYYAAKDRFSSINRGEWLYEIPKQTVPVELSGKHIPLLVTFDDITDPKTLRQVDPANLAAIFGPGVRMKAVTLAVTDEPTTAWQAGKVAKILPQAFFVLWGSLQREALARGIRDPYFSSLIGKLSRSDFQIGEK